MRRCPPVWPGAAPASATTLTARRRPSPPAGPPEHREESVLRLATPWHGLLAFERPDEPFTPAESARAHRLAGFAEIVEISQRGRRTAG